MARAHLALGAAEPEQECSSVCNSGLGDMRQQTGKIYFVFELDANRTAKARQSYHALFAAQYASIPVCNTMLTIQSFPPGEKHTVLPNRVADLT